MIASNRLLIVAPIFIAAFAATAAPADMLPLKHGIYVPVGSACKGASNAEMLNYWGENNSIGDARTECTIKKLTKKGVVYTVSDVCHDIRTDSAIEGRPRAFTINSPTNFKIEGIAYRYCGPTVQF